jgi:four helix bundle protein
MKKSDLSERLFEFAVRCIKYLRTLSYDTEYKIIRYQLIKSSTSAGANYEESQGATSKADFHNKVKISLREMKESNCWLKIIKAISNP